MGETKTDWVILGIDNSFGIELQRLPGYLSGGDRYCRYAAMEHFLIVQDVIPVDEEYHAKHLLLPVANL
nr:hypothetical protein [Enterobacter quasiroggenkampii]